MLVRELRGTREQSSAEAAAPEPRCQVAADLAGIPVDEDTAHQSPPRPVNRGETYLPSIRGAREPAALH
jgi:hypothetical protein